MAPPSPLGGAFPLDAQSQTPPSRLGGATKRRNTITRAYAPSRGTWCGWCDGTDPSRLRHRCCRTRSGRAGQPRRPRPARTNRVGERHTRLGERCGDALEIRLDRRAGQDGEAGGRRIHPDIGGVGTRGDGGHAHVRHGVIQGAVGPNRAGGAAQEHRHVYVLRPARSRGNVSAGGQGARIKCKDRLVIAEAT